MQESVKGIGMMLIWCVVSAIGQIMTTLVTLNIGPVLLCFGISLIATLFFLCVRINHVDKLITKIKTNLTTVIYVSITTAGCWFLSIYPLKFIEPSITNATLLSIMPMTTFLIDLVIYRKKTQLLQNLFISITFLIGIFYIITVTLIHNAHQNHHLLLAFLSCFIAGVFLAVNNIQTKKLSVKEFQPLEILMFRFILLTIVTGLFSINKLTTLYNARLMVDIVFVAFSLIIIPQIVLQYALKELEPITLSIMLALNPAIILMFELASGHWSLNGWNGIGIIYFTIVSIGSSLFCYWKINKK